MKLESWYVLEDGRTVHPSEVKHHDGSLVHSSGVPVAMRYENVPKTRGVFPDEMKAEEAPKPKRTYKNREVKAEQ